MVAATLVAGGYVLVAIRGPNGIPALLNRWQEIRALERRNAALKAEVDARSERLKKLRESLDEQELEIRRRLEMLRPGEKEFKIPPRRRQPDEEAPPAQRAR